MKKLIKKHQNGANIQQDKNWLLNWYKKRLPVLDNINDELNIIPWAIEKGLNVPYKFQEFNDGSMGEYFPSKNSYIQFSPSNTEEGRFAHTGTHEYNHAIQFAGGEENYTNILTPGAYGVNIYTPLTHKYMEDVPIIIYNKNDIQYGDSDFPLHGYRISQSEFYSPEQVELNKTAPSSEAYFDFPWEQHSRLMQFRQANNLDPTKTDYTSEDVEAMKNNPNIKDFNILNRYSIDYILRMLNTWASNTKKNITNYAAKGSKLIRR